jgi:hypothetical protein
MTFARTPNVAAGSLRSTDSHVSAAWGHVPLTALDRSIPQPTIEPVLAPSLADFELSVEAYERSRRWADSKPRSFRQACSKPQPALPPSSVAVRPVAEPLREPLQSGWRE